jgi:hypothetical protein
MSRPGVRAHLRYRTVLRALLLHERHRPRRRRVNVRSALVAQRELVMEDAALLSGDAVCGL